MTENAAIAHQTLADVDELLESGQTKEAEEVLLAMHRSNPHFADVCNRIGQLYFGMGDFGRAREFFLQAIKINPDYTEASLNLAVTYNELKQYTKAKETMEQAGRRASRKKANIEPFIAGKLANMHKETGDIYRQLGLLDESITEYRKALDLSPGFPDIQVRLAVSLREMGAVEESMDILALTIEYRPDFVDARIQMGISYFSQGFVDRAREQWQEALKTDPGNPKARMYIGFTTGKMS
jgi:tetratricopeptide (TPR) repeat protein